MDELIRFNGVNVLLTTAQDLSEVQSYREDADVVISVYSDDIRILWTKPNMLSRLPNGQFTGRAE